MLEKKYLVEKETPNRTLPGMQEDEKEAAAR